jgi:hypothetical protein
MRATAAGLVFGLMVAAQTPANLSMSWTPTGGPLIGNQRGIVVRTPQILLFGAGMRRSDDAGTTWRPFNSRSPSVVAFDERALFATSAAGLSRSRDMGESWIPCGEFPSQAVRREIGSVRGDDTYVYVTVNQVGLFRSDDGCQSWNEVPAPWPLSFPPSLVYANGAQVVIRALGGTFLSVDAGANWHNLQPSLDTVLTVEPGCDDTIVVGTSKGLFSSQDNGLTWSIVGLAGRWVAAVAVRTCREWFVVANDQGRSTSAVLRSNDAGSTWRSAQSGLTDHPIAALAVDERGSVYAAGVAGAFRWTDEGSWRQFGPPLDVNAVVATTWGDVLTAAGWMGLSQMPGAGGSWRLLPLGHDAFTAAVTSDDGLIVAAENFVRKSQDRGQTWHRTGLARVAQAFLTLPGGTVLAGTQTGIFRSSDDGETWTERSLGLSVFNICSFAAAPDGTVYAGSWTGEVFRSSDLGDRWRPMAKASADRVKSLVVLKNGELLAGTDFGVLRWDNTEAEWRLTASGSRFVVNTLIADRHETLFAATTGRGVLASLDKGLTWLPVGTGLPQDKVTALALDADGSIVAATPAGVFRAKSVESSGVHP